jgi:hypothetical protein
MASTDDLPEFGILEQFPLKTEVSGQTNSGQINVEEVSFFR